MNSNHKLTRNDEDNSSLEKYNNLINEKSPYLLQHATNPVDWYPWDKEAFQKAREEDKPIFLSIGYSTCHWCHVMAHESFEDSEVAKLINETFISIKVDREERPDIDKIYMTVCQVMTGSGGWPLTIIMTPDKKPFFAGTYFPKTSRFGRIGLIDLIERIKELWNTKRKELMLQSEQIIHAVENISDEMPGNQLDRKDLRNAYNQLSLRYDEKLGGFGSEPKFPMPHNLLFLLRFWNRTGKAEVLEMVEHTLEEMRKGGIYDHIGYGFHRYSTDSHWLVPHFEKMLYDQALLAIAYLEVYQVTKKEKFAHTAREIFTYVLRDMTSPEGAFYSAEDADSEGVEGKFYVWTKEEILNLFNKNDAEFIMEIYNVEDSGNYLDEASKEKTGKNILHLKASLDVLADRFGISYKEFKKKFDGLTRKMFDYREKRIHPGKDDKILTDWNGLMIAALAKGARVLNDNRYAEAAIKSTRFILNTLINSDNRLLRRYRDTEAEIQAFADDYAFLIFGLIELYETTFNTEFLETALELNEEMINHFWDDNLGGFYFSADDGENLLVRQKEIYDGAIPSGNSVAMFNLLRLSYLTGNSEFEHKAELISRVFAEKIKDNSSAFTQLMIAVDFAIGPSYSLVISGDKNNEDTRSMLDSIRSKYYPNKTIIYRSTDRASPEIDKFADYIKYFDKYNDKATAYVCINKMCKKPTNQVEIMLDSMKSHWN